MKHFIAHASPLAQLALLNDIDIMPPVAPGAGVPQNVQVV